MFDAFDEITALQPLGAQLGRLVAKLPPGTPEFYAAFSAHEAFKRAERTIRLGGRYGAGRGAEDQG